MISIDEIKKRIGYKDNEDLIKDYNGLDFSACHDTGHNQEEIKERNKIMLYTFFPEYFNLDLLNSPHWNLECWKGSMWWNDEYEKCRIDFTGKSTAEIIYYLISTKPWINKKDICRIITKEQRYAVLKRQSWKCNSCGQILKFSNNSKWDGKIAHVDHIFPFSKRHEYPRGAQNINENTNLQALCPDCNFSKKNKKIH